MSDYTTHHGAMWVGGLQYRFAYPVTWRIGSQSGPVYTVPAGFEFDVSVPFLLRWVFNPHRSEYHKAAALHDHMLISGWSRATAAAEFYNALRADGVSRWRRSLMVAGVITWTVK